MVDPNDDTERVIATRRLRTSAGSEVVATLLAPVEADGEWECAFRITGLPNTVSERIRGVDSMQAIGLGIEGLRFYLERADDRLTWLDGEPGDLGFPRRIPPGFGVAVEKHLVQLVNDEIARLVEAKALARGVKPPPYEK
jgi:hypothetical protein